jgi:protein-L-isoaspartate(D-aspartate) O-methyltransferase
MRMNRIDEAFKKVDRRQFLPIAMRPLAGLDRALPLGHGQTNSQPSTVRQMLLWLDVQLGQSVLDIGSGSGWTTAILAHIVGEHGRVYALERIPELVKFGMDNCKRLSIRNAEFFKAGPIYGLPEHAPYDRILVSASAREFPIELLDQVKVNGKMVLPVQDTIFEVKKLSGVKTSMVPHSGYAFVPLV